jgi:hypothetical protein
VDHSVPAETPQDPADLLLVPLDQSPVCVRIPLPALADVLELRSIRRASLAVFDHGHGIRHTSSQFGQEPFKPDTPYPAIDNGNSHV